MTISSVAGRELATSVDESAHSTHQGLRGDQWEGHSKIDRRKPSPNPMEHCRRQGVRADDLIRKMTNSVAARKERRQFPVWPFPVLMQILQEVYPDDGPFHMDQCDSLVGPLTDWIMMAFNVRWFMGSVMGVTYDRIDEPPFPRTLTIQVTNRIKLDLPGQPTMRQYLKDILSQSVRSVGRALNIWEVLELVSGSEIMTGDPREDVEQYISSVLSLLRALQDRPMVNCPDLVKTFQSRWFHGPTPHRLVTRLYPSRGDDRAFVTFRSLMAHLAGATLEALLNPAASSDYFRTSLHRHCPKRGKNVIHWDIQVPGNHHAAVLVGDISSFTGSCVNGVTWVLTLWLALRRLNPELVRRPFTVLIHGEPLETSLDAIMYLYIRTTFAAPVWDTSAMEEYYAAGGYLGVPFNLTQSVYLLDLVHEALVRTALTIGLTVKFRIGGDDHTLVVIGPLDRVEKFITAHNEAFARWVGHPKGDTTVVFQGQFHGLHPTPFCQKPLELHLENGRLSINSLYNLPLMSHLTAPPPRDLRAFHKSWLEFHGSLQGAFLNWEDSEFWKHVYTQAFRIMNDPPFVLVAPAGDKVINWRLLETLDYPITENARALINDVPAYLTSTSTVAERTTLNERWSYLMASGRGATFRDGDRYWWMTREEWTSLVRPRDLMRVPRCEGWDVLEAAEYVVASLTRLRDYVIERAEF